MKLIKKMLDNQKGFTLTEIVIAMAVFGVVGVGVMFGLNASSKTIASTHEITVAESLSRSIIEYVKRCGYDDSFAADHPEYDSDNEDYGVLLGLDGDPYYGDYTVEVDIERLDAKADGTDNDDGIQKVIVEIKYQGRRVLITEAYKVDR